MWLKMFQAALQEGHRPSSILISHNRLMELKKQAQSSSSTAIPQLYGIDVISNQLCPEDQGFLLGPNGEILQILRFE